MPYKINDYSFQLVEGDDAEIFSKSKAIDGIVYVIPSQFEMVLKCPCGCEDVIDLNTIPDHPYWTFKEPNTISPSVNKLYGCKSHFSIINGKVQ